MESILDSTYVINMEFDQVRLEEFDSMMAACNWNYFRYEAVNGKRLISSWANITDTDEYETLRTQQFMKKRYVSETTWLSPSEIGCLLSHITLWENLVNDPSKNRIAIFEDDARTHVDGNTVRRLLSDFYTYLSSNDIPEPDMLYLGKALDDCMSYEKVWGNIYKSLHPVCLHAYIITKRGAQILLNMAPYNVPIDMVPIRAIENKRLNVMVFHPSIFFQDVFNIPSNLRQLNGAINHTTECLVSMQHVTSQTWKYTFVIVIALIAASILFIAHMLFQ